jgi:fumarate reductase subunit D
MRQPSNAAYRRDVLWLAALVHRVSGVLLACFLPLHFLALGLALNGAERLDGFLKWTDNRWVKAAETGLVLLLAVHLLGGIRILVIESLQWRDGQKRLALGAAAAATAVAAAFLISVLI